MLQGLLDGRPVEGDSVDPGPVLLRPLGPIGEHVAVPDEELVEPVPCRDEVLAHVLLGADEVTDGFLVGRRDVDRGQLPGPVELGQLVGVAPIGLDPVSGLRSPVSGLPSDQRRRDHLAGDTHPDQLAVKLEAADSGLVAAAQLRVFCLQPGEGPSNGLGVVRNLRVLRTGRSL